MLTGGRGVHKNLIEIDPVSVNFDDPIVEDLDKEDKEYVEDNADKDGSIVNQSKQE